ncbi:MAG TPA: GNAT family N-acetyltransferase [Phototrophicaceae bacterium]|jgi:ribosomal protein S18 acetylase RimI-like enzyme|nr:GNAT family N-acetyltransferase [Phototrophicaceae bacterium]
MTELLRIIPCTGEHRAAIRRVLQQIGWADQYITAAEKNAVNFSQDVEHFGTYAATIGDSNEPIGFLYVQYYDWNRLCQIQFLAVDPAYQRRGIASALVNQAENFARSRQGRGIYVDTPTNNLRGRAFYEAAGYQVGYIMPRYYETALDGVTYQKFFD